MMRQVRTFNFDIPEQKQRLETLTASALLDFWNLQKVTIRSKSGIFILWKGEVN